MRAKLPSGLLAAWIITGVVVLLSANAAFACGSHHGKGHKIPTFAEVDANGDGVIVAEELQAMQARRMAERARAGGKMKHAGKHPGFESIDTDGNGEVTDDEFAAHQAERIQQRGK